MTKAAKRIQEQARLQTPLVRKLRGDYRAEHVRTSDADRAVLSLAEFVRQGWHVLEGDADLHWNWHLDAKCEHLEAILRGDVRRLALNEPPGHMKSLVVAVFWPAWMWLRKPGWRAIFSSYAMDLAVRDSVRCRDLIESDWYQTTFRPNWRLSSSQNVKSWFNNTAGGSRFSTSVGSRATGFRGDCVVVDDPLNATDAGSKLAREAAIRWWDRTMSSRLNDPRTGSRVIVMQRLHEEDLTGHVLAKGGYEHLCLMTEFEPERRCSTSIGWSDPREERGELLFPSLFNRQVVDEAKVDLGSDGFAGQHQQRPAAAEGSIFKRRWWRFWLPAGVKAPPVTVLLDDGTLHECETVVLPENFDEVAQSWDMTFKDTTGSDFVCGGVWGRLKAERFLLDAVHDRLSFTATCRALVRMHESWPQARRILVEDKANGPAVISQLKSTVPGLIAIEPEGGKIARANAVSPLCEAGNVILPHPKLMKWVDSMITETADFPFSAHDDWVDMATQILNHWAAKKPGSVREASEY